MEFIIPIIGGLILYLIFSEIVKVPGQNLQRKFISLGTLRGLSKKHIISVVGQPNSVSAVGDGTTLYQWIDTGYHIALLFRGEICEGVSHEFKA
jgi:hypothetical protein